MKKFRVGDCVCIKKFGDEYMPPRPNKIRCFGIIVSVDRIMNMKRYEIFSEGGFVIMTSDYLLEKVCIK